MGEKQFNFTVVDGCLTVYADGVSIDIENAVNPSLYNEAIKAIRDNDNEALHEIVTRKMDKAEEVSEFSDSNFEVRNGNLYLKGEYTMIPFHIAKRVKEFMESKLPYMPLVNFWKNVRNNPSRISYEGLLRFLEHNKQPLTSDGCFIGYKKVKKHFIRDGEFAPAKFRECRDNDGKRCYYTDTHSSTFDNGPGATPKMDRFQIDPDPNVTCSQGLHVAAWEYAASFSGNTVVSVKVNPSDVVAVPTDYNNQKIRTCGYEVIEECKVKHDVDFIDDDDDDCCNDGSCHDDSDEIYDDWDLEDLRDERDSLVNEEKDQKEQLKRHLDFLSGAANNHPNNIKNEEDAVAHSEKIIDELKDDLVGTQQRLKIISDKIEEMTKSEQKSKETLGSALDRSLYTQRDEW